MSEVEVIAMDDADSVALIVRVDGNVYVLASSEPDETGPEDCEVCSACEDQCIFHRGVTAGHAELDGIVRFALDDPESVYYVKARQERERQAQAQRNAARKRDRARVLAHVQRLRDLGKTPCCHGHGPVHVWEPRGNCPAAAPVEAVA